MPYLTRIGKPSITSPTWVVWLDILLGYPILVRYGIAILPRFDCLALDRQQHGSGLLPPPKTRSPAAVEQISQTWNEPVVVPDSEALDQAVRRHKDEKGKKGRPTAPTCSPTAPPPSPPKIPTPSPSPPPLVHQTRDRAQRQYPHPEIQGPLRPEPPQNKRLPPQRKQFLLGSHPPPSK